MMNLSLGIFNEAITKVFHRFREIYELFELEFYDLSNDSLVYFFLF